MERGHLTTTTTELTKTLENAFLDIAIKMMQVYCAFGMLLLFSLLATVFNMHLTYSYLDDRLTGKIDPDGSGDFRKTCFDIEGVKIPTGLYLGLTSATGDLADNHDVIALKIWQLDGTDAGPRHDITPEVLNLVKQEEEGLFTKNLFLKFVDRQPCCRQITVFKTEDV